MIVDILKLDNFGRGITYINNKICFVENAFEKEQVKIEIIKETSKYIEAKQVEVIKPSPYRIKSKCKYSSICGGCTFQELDYKKENEYKENKVKDLVTKVLKKNENVVKDIVFENESNYRNKVILHNSNNKVGLYKKNTHDIVEIDNCLLLANRINKELKEINKYKNSDEILIRCSNNEENVLVSTNNNEEQIITNIADKKYYVSVSSFFQVNRTLTEKLYNEVKNIIEEESPENVLDLYCGTGSIGIYVSDSCKKIIGIDYNKSNINDAIKNKELNNINNIDFICDKVENKIDDFNNIDLIIVDPPRAGLDNKTKDNLIRISPKKIVYVSCDLNTLIRDLKDLSENFEIEYIKPFNLFPRTYHVECVCLLNKKE